LGGVDINRGETSRNWGLGIHHEF